MLFLSVEFASESTYLGFETFQILVKYHAREQSDELH